MDSRALRIRGNGVADLAAKLVAEQQIKKVIAMTPNDKQSHESLAVKEQRATKWRQMTTKVNEVKETPKTREEYRTLTCRERVLLTRLRIGHQT